VRKVEGTCNQVDGDWYTRRYYDLIGFVVEAAHERTMGSDGLSQGRHAERIRFCDLELGNAFPPSRLETIP
jgi:hypothetical protein